MNNHNLLYNYNREIEVSSDSENSYDEELNDDKIKDEDMNLLCTLGFPKDQVRNALLLCSEYKVKADKYLKKLFPKKDTKLPEIFNYIIEQAGT